MRAVRCAGRSANPVALQMAPRSSFALGGRSRRGGNSAGMPTIAVFALPPRTPTSIVYSYSECIGHYGTRCERGTLNRTAHFSPSGVEIESGSIAEFASGE